MKGHDMETTAEQKRLAIEEYFEEYDHGSPEDAAAWRAWLATASEAELDSELARCGIVIHSPGGINGHIHAGYSTHIPHRL